MNLTCETILNFYTHKNRKIFCHIKFVPMKGRKQMNTCRSLTPEQWNTFDKELEKLLDGINSPEDGNKENLGQFAIRPNVGVKVLKSKLSLKYFYKLLAISGDSEKDILRNTEHIAVVLECMLDLQNEPKQFETKSVEPLHENVLKYQPTCIRETESSQGKINVNEVINETDDEIVPLQDYRSLILKAKKNTLIKNEIDIELKSKERFTEDMQTNICIGKDAITHKKEFKEITKLSEFSPDCSHQNTRKRSKTLDSMPKELETKDENVKVSKRYDEGKNTVISDFKFLKSKEKKTQSNKICQATNGKEKNMEQKSAKVLKSISSSEDENFPELCTRVKKQTKSHTTNNDSDFDDVTKVNKRKCLHESVISSPVLDVTNNASPTTDVQRDKNSEQLTPTSLRRSDRSPSKPKRFIEEIKGVNLNRQKKSKKNKTSPKNKELFGTDDDDEDDNDFESNNVNNIVNDKNNIVKKVIKTSVSETPTSKKPTICISSSSSSAKNKRKVDKFSDCEQEKRDIGKWLSKKKTSSTDPEAVNVKMSKKSQRPSSPLSKPSKKSKPSKRTTDSKEVCRDPVTSIPIRDNFDMPSKKELEEMRNKSKIKQKENEKLKAELDKMRPVPPQEVENLSLQDMSISDILDTFSTYKSELDKIYKQNYKRDYIKGHDGINHCFVIQLLQPHVQMKMLEKLTEVYSNSTNAMQATLYANALLPEWIIRVYMEKFNFTRQEAINQIKAQDDYRLHMEEQNEGSFIFN